MNKRPHEEMPEQSEESKTIDRILKEAYVLMNGRKKIAKEEVERYGKPGVTDESESRKKIIKEHIERLRELGMTEGELSKLVASLEDPLLTNF
jgi:hypothetical protein